MDFYADSTDMYIKRGRDNQIPLIGCSVWIQLELNCVLQPSHQNPDQQIGPLINLQVKIPLMFGHLAPSINPNFHIHPFTTNDSELAITNMTIHQISQRIHKHSAITICFYEVVRFHVGACWANKFLKVLT